LVAPCAALAIFAVGVLERETAHTEFWFSYLMCEYAAGVLAYFLAGPYGLDWVSPSGYSPQRAYDRPMLYVMQLLWYATTAYFLYRVYAFEDTRGAFHWHKDVYGRVVLSVSTACCLVLACGFASDVFEEDATGFFVSRKMRQAQQSWLSLPLRLFIRVLASPCWYPIASVSYTAYLNQGIAMSLMQKNHWSMSSWLALDNLQDRKWMDSLGKTSEYGELTESELDGLDDDEGGVARLRMLRSQTIGLSRAVRVLAEKGGILTTLDRLMIDFVLLVVATTIVCLVGLAVSLLVERPLMALLYPLTQKGGSCACTCPCGPCAMEEEAPPPPPPPIMKPPVMDKPKLYSMEEGDPPPHEWIDWGFMEWPEPPSGQDQAPDAPATKDAKRSTLRWARKRWPSLKRAPTPQLAARTSSGAPPPQTSRPLQTQEAQSGPRARIAPPEGPPPSRRRRGSPSTSNRGAE